MTIRDPVCGCYIIQADHAGAAVQYKGNTYYFCSRECREKFQKTMAQLAPTARAGQVAGATTSCATAEEGPAGRQRGRDQ